MVGVLHGGGGGVSHLVVSDSAAPWAVAHQAPLSMMGCYTHLQGIFLTQGSNPGLLHCRQILYHLNHQGSLVISILSSLVALKSINVLLTPKYLSLALAICPEL